MLGEALASQAEIHAPWGGVVPKLAQEAHEEAIHRVVASALAQAEVPLSCLDAVAVTQGPGLSLCLRVGMLKARELSYEQRLPLVLVHHMEAHALVARMGREADVPFPFLCLLVSGGHNLLVLVQSVGRYVQLGTTMDDALGEAYDKVARMLGLQLKPHGGAALEALARRGNAARYPFTVPMRRHANCDFSFAGLKTSVRLVIEQELGEVDSEEEGEESPEDLQVKADIAASFQRVAVAHLCERTARATEWARELLPCVGTLVVAGGVASNTYVREQLAGVAEAAGMKLVVPPPRYCTDNGVMVAWTGLERVRLGMWEPPPHSVAPLEGEWIDLRPRWPLTAERHDRSSPATRSTRKRGLHTSLTDMTSAAMRDELILM